MTDLRHHTIDPRLEAILTSFALNAPSDGDCLHTAPRVTKSLQEQGFQARTATIAGWLDLSATILGFLHQVTICGETVLDGTARQFYPTLPSAWISPTPEYLRRLADATGIKHATTFPG
ncbi:hypothetical protein [Nocardia aobensis]|uniref:hypothetical protein n=1 Tax=Nocardia aobensis TaxID=257277 RepID=UPI000564E53F|nr:hypothetical protein [Nocardia aobensis]